MSRDNFSRSTDELFKKHQLTFRAFRIPDKNTLVSSRTKLLMFIKVAMNMCGTTPKTQLFKVGFYTSMRMRHYCRSRLIKAVDCVWNSIPRIYKDVSLYHIDLTISIKVWFILSIVPFCWGVSRIGKCLTIHSLRICMN